MAAQQTDDPFSWPEATDAMRRPLADLHSDPRHAPRIVSRHQAAMEALVAQFRRSWGLGPHEMSAISVLWEYGRMSMSELGRRIPLSRAAVTTLVDRLERMQYVKRVPDLEDRRRTMLELTDRLERESHTTTGAWSSRVEQYVRELDADDWATVVRVIDGLRTIAREEADALSRKLTREAAGPRETDSPVRSLR